MGAAAFIFTITQMFNHSYLPGTLLEFFFQYDPFFSSTCVAVPCPAFTAVAIPGFPPAAAIPTISKITGRFKLMSQVRIYFMIPDVLTFTLK